MPAHYAYLGLMIALSSSLANKSLNYVSQPVKVNYAPSVPPRIPGETPVPLRSSARSVSPQHASRVVASA